METFDPSLKYLLEHELWGFVRFALEGEEVELSKASSQLARRCCSTGQACDEAQDRCGRHPFAAHTRPHRADDPLATSADVPRYGARFVISSSTARCDARERTSRNSPSSATGLGAYA